MNDFVLSGNKEILIKSRLSLLEHGLWWDELFCWTVYSKGFTSVNIAYDYAEHVRVEKNRIWLKAVPGTFLPCILKMSFLTCSSYRSVVSQLLWSWESHNVEVTVVQSGWDARGGSFCTCVNCDKKLKNKLKACPRCVWVNMGAEKVV